ncbi:MAG: hypothetical protein ACREVI_01185 [Steroidobacteraceae bacterium]
MSKERLPQAGYPLDDTGIRLMLAREAIQLARLPLRPPDHILGGSGDGTDCAVCGLSIGLAELGYELVFAQNGRHSVSHKLHIRCFAAWETECRNAGTAASGKAGAENAPGSVDDSAHSGNGRDAGHGRETP